MKSQRTTRRMPIPGIPPSEERVSLEAHVGCHRWTLVAAGALALLAACVRIASTADSSPGAGVAQGASEKRSFYCLRGYLCYRNETKCERVRSAECEAARARRDPRLEQYCERLCRPQPRAFCMLFRRKGQTGTTADGGNELEEVCRTKEDCDALESTLDLGRTKVRGCVETSP